MGLINWLGRQRTNLGRALIGPRTLERWADNIETLSHPGLEDRLSSAFTSFSQGQNPLDQNFEKYIKSDGLFPWHSACVGAIADAGAEVPYDVMVNGEPATDHPLKEKLENPNPEQGYQGFMQSILQQIRHTGWAHIAAVNDRNPALPFMDPDELWVMRSDAMKPIFDKTLVRRGRAGSALAGWSYEGDAKPYRIPPEEIQVIKLPHPYDPIFPLSPMKQLECTLNWMYAALQWNKRYFDNNTSAGLAFLSDKKPARGMAEAFERKITEDHAGYRNAGKHLFLWGMGEHPKIQRMTDGPQSASFMDVLMWGRQETLAIHKCPPFVVAILEHANWSNSESQQRYFYQHAIKPNLRLVFDTLNTSEIVLSHGENVKLVPDYSGIAALQDDQEAQARTFAIYVGKRVMTPNEVRAKLEMAPLEGGDEFVSNNPLEGLFGGNGNGNGSDPDEDTAPEEEMEARAAAFWALVHESKALGKTKAARDLRWKAFDLRTAPILRAWDRSLRGLFKSLRGEILEEINRRQVLEFGDPIRGKAADDPIPPNLSLEALFDLGRNEAEWHELLDSLAEMTLRSGAEDMLQEINDEAVPFDVTDPQIQAWLNQQTAMHIRTILENRLTEVQDVVAKAAAEGKNIGELEILLRDRFDEQSRAWSMRIARTETAGLYNRGAELGMEEAGVQTKEWLSSRDSKVRESHWAMDGQSVALGTDFLFPNGAHGPHPGSINDPGESINCRCTITVGES